MLLLNSALCSKNFRKVGIIHSSINICCQGICLLALIITSILSQGSQHVENMTYTEGGQMIMTSRVVENVESSFATKILLVLLVFDLLDITVYSLLIIGLVSRKPSLLSIWLSFAPLELIVVQAILIFGVYEITRMAPAGIGILVLILFILIISFMFHNMCIVFSARHGFIHDQETQDRNLTGYQPVNVNATAVPMNSSAPPMEQCNSQHFEYNATIGQYVPCKCIYPHCPPNYQGKELQGPDY